MYDLAQHEQQRFVDQERYDDEYDEYLLWTSTFPHVMIRVNDPFQIPDIPSRNLLQHLSDAGSTPPASPLSVSYTMTPNFKFPADEDNESDHEKSPVTPAKDISTPSDAQSKLDVKVAKRGLPTRKRSYSNFF